MCPALWIHRNNKHGGRLTMISIIIIIIKITSPTNNLLSSTSQKWKKKKVCVSVMSWAVVWIPPWWRAGGSGVVHRDVLTSLHLVHQSLSLSIFHWSRDLFSSLPCFLLLSLSVLCPPPSTLVPAFVSVYASLSCSEGQCPWQVLQHICLKYARLQNLNFSTSGQ